MRKFSSMAELLDAREQSKRWARDYLRLSQIGKQSLVEGWCRALHNDVWQKHFDGCCRGMNVTFADIRMANDDVACWKRNAAINPRLEAAIVLCEPIEKHMTQEEVAHINAHCSRIKASGKGLFGNPIKEMPK